MTSAQPLVVELVGFLERHISEEVAGIVSSVVADAHAWVNPDGPPIVVTLDWPSDPSPDVIVISSERLYLPAARLDGATDPTRPEQLVNLVWDLHGAVGGMAVTQQGISSEGEGIAVIEASGAFHQYCRLVDNGEFDPMLLNLPVSPTTLLDLGKVAGWAAAGDRRAAAKLSELDGEQRGLTEKLVALLSEAPPFPPRPLVES
jgi:hypothetical protein